MIALGHTLLGVNGSSTTDLTFEQTMQVGEWVGWWVMQFVSTGVCACVLCSFPSFVVTGVLLPECVRLLHVD